MPVLLVPLYEFNRCHHPAGSPVGGEFCSTEGGGGAGERRVKYPRTPHLPWSESADPDDVHLSSERLKGLVGKRVVITEKMDGENTTMYRDGIHARSLDNTADPTMSRVKALWASIRHQIPPGIRIVGENVTYRHSVGYENLPAPFLVFSIWDGDRALSWDETKAMAASLGLTVVPELWEGTFTGETPPVTIDPTRTEGYVMRVAEGFDLQDFGSSVAKYVRKGHVNSATHWKKQLVPNVVRRGSR